MNEYTRNLLLMALMSMLPIIELKGAIPVGLAVDVPLWAAFSICFLCSSLPTPFLLLLLKPIMRFCREHIAFMHRFFEWLVERSMKHADKIERYEYWGLFLFVAIPLPGTGIWTGSLLASLFDLDWKKATLMIVAGNLIAGLAILALAKMGILALKSIF